ncbi:chemotaxis protein CheB [Plectonema radiosum NIES-515]|uniref:protein-glutamate methylesterase n=1 Tax=Plectonema radiosum NIES-515 TaxID=2986073 RepID=A0ABT3AVL8_9CYAN|nr:chemotaxis protein CheB [Plectonema radiosum]MCV3213169.1 chemotaxis protein CheB [Plectonema radiosum NIES-515]
MMKFDITVIGASWGGLQAIETILASLPKNLAFAIAVAQHRHKDSEDELVNCLQRSSLLPVVEVIDKIAIAPGQIYLAPADYHLLIEPGHFALSTEAPVSYARPSIDVLFESTADAYGERAIGVILTGSSKDGAQGLAKVKTYGGLAIVQEPTTAVSRIMPDAAIAAVVSATILPLPEIAPFLVNLCSSSLFHQKS